MGSFNTTCAISHSAITPGDKVRLFFLASQDGHSNDAQKNILSIGCKCYPWDDFKVIGGMSLEATYEDYNSYSFDEDSIFSQLILKQIKENYLENVSVEGEEYNSSHDHMDINVNDLDWEKILDMIHSGRLYLKGYGRGVKPAVGMMAIHESVYNIMMKETYEQYKCDTDDYRDSYYVTVGFEDELKESIAKHTAKDNDESWKEFYKYFEEEVKNGEVTEDEAIKQSKRMAKFNKEMDRDTDCNFVFQSRAIIQNLRSFSDKILKLKGTENEIEVNDYSDDDLIYKHAESIFFNGRMMTHNFMYRPLITSGQEYDHVADGIFWQKVSNALLTKSGSWEEDEHILTRKVSKQWQEINLSEILERFKDWFEDEDLEKRIDSLKPIFNNFNEKEVFVIASSDIKNEKYKPLIEMIWNKELDLHINIDTKEIYNTL